MEKSTDYIVFFFLIFLLIFIVLQWNTIRSKACEHESIRKNSALSKLFNCDGSVVLPSPTSATGASSEISQPNTGIEEGAIQSSSTTPKILGSSGTETIATKNGVTVSQVTGGIPAGLTAPISAESYMKQYVSSPTLLPGTTSPVIQGVTIWFYTGELKEHGMYEFEIKASYASGCSSGKTVTLKNQKTMRMCTTTGECYTPVAVGSGSLTKEDIERIVSKYCPSDYWQAPLSGFGYSYTDKDANLAPYVCLVYHRALKDSDIFLKAPESAQLLALEKNIKLAIIVSTDTLKQLLSDCKPTSAPYDYVYVDYRVIKCEIDKSGSIGSCSPYTEWRRGVVLRVSTMPSLPQAPSDVAEKYYSNFEFIEVNGYTYSIIPLHALGISDFLVLGVTETALGLAFSAILVVFVYLVLKRFRKVRR